MTAILYTRYGIRRYNEAFQQRNTNFWTVGTHFEWEVSDRIEAVLGYHFERGLAEGRKQPELRDDLSYINHFCHRGTRNRVDETLESRNRLTL